MHRLRLGVTALAITGLTLPASAEVFSRGASAEGSVVARKSGEEVKFIEVPAWRGVEVSQDLLAGDTLRTNSTGSLAIRFIDNTLVRMGRETVLRVRKIDGATSSEFDLEGGTIWGRAERGGSGLVIDTPAAAAAIRGTDWALSTNGGRTTLTVLEGTVELTNSAGSVTVRQGEGAVATLGQAPRKYTLVNLEEREQMLLYREARDTFSALPVSGEASGKDRRRILARPEAGRSREDWLTLAETGLAHDGRQAAQAALARLSRPLPAGLEARALLVEAMIAGHSTRYSEAISLFRKARPGLSGERRVMADYGEWIAASLDKPNAAPTSPALGRAPATAGEAIAQAAIVAHLKSQIEAIDLLRKAEERFPDDADLAAMRARLAFELDRRDETRAALERARKLDPDNTSYLLINARFRTAIEGDLDGALADLKRAADLSPGDDAVWNEIGIVQSDRNAPVEADAAHRRAIALNPENPAIRANYARFLMDNDQMAAAERQIAAAEALDAQSYAVLAAKGRYLLRLGKTAEGEAALQQAVAVNPTDGDALIGLAIANYQSGADEEATQALDNADRFDPANPSISLMRAGIAIDQYRADDAIEQAREALRRRQARGGYYSGYDANRQASSYLGVALGNVGLAEWGQYHAGRAFDPFLSTTYIDEASAGRTSPFAGAPLSGLDRFSNGPTAASELQARMLDPLAIAAESGRNGIERRNFFEAALGAGVSDQGASLGWNSDILLQGMSYAPLPVSYYIQGDIARPQSERDNDANDLEGGLFQIGLRPTLTDNVYLFGNDIRTDIGYPGLLWDPAPYTQRHSRDRQIGGAWSHTISERNVLQAFIVASDGDSLTQSRQRFGEEPETYEYRSDLRTREHSIAYGVGHMIGLGPLTLRYGAEGGKLRYTQSEAWTDVDTGDFYDFGSVSGKSTATRAYADGHVELSDSLQFQAGAYVTRFDGESGLWGPVDYRAGVAWAPVDNHWLRAYYRQDTQFTSNFTLSPVNTVGLAPMVLPLYWGGQTETTALRWDAEWNERFFTAVEYQHQRFNGSSIQPEDFLYQYDTTDGKIDRVQVSANYWLGNGIGLFGSFTWNESEDTSPAIGRSDPVPLIPDYVGQFGFTWVHPSRITLSVAQTFVGKRVGAHYVGAPFIDTLEPYSTTDARMAWKSESGHLEAGFSVLNIFNNDIDMATGLPAPGRTFLAAVKARF